MVPQNGQQFTDIKAGKTADPLPNYDNSHFLRFEPAVVETEVYNQDKRHVKIDLLAQLSGQFSLSPTNNQQSGSTHLELTFYRRNLFQVSCTVHYNSIPKYASSDKSGIVAMSMEVSLSGSDESKQPKLLYIPLKSEKNQQDQAPRIKRVNGNASKIETIDWTRLQFNSATLHNGRRKLQNYFTLRVAMFAELENRKRVRLLYADSRPIVVRGRNPRFYKNRLTVPITDKMNSQHLQQLMEDRQKAASHEDEEDVSEDEGMSEDEGIVGDDSNAVYQYIPMPITYYDNPVDVVYRPHGITHATSTTTTTPTSTKC